MEFDRIVDMYHYDYVDEKGVGYLVVNKVVGKLGFCYFENNIRYTRWDMVDEYFQKIGIDTTNGRPKYISDNVYTALRSLVEKDWILIQKGMKERPIFNKRIKKQR